ncbi:MAG: nucleotide-binding protein [candidate division Zixibacteria bacterium]|nr:nucleotide-binding protein [candidate division Zixibacteria bacterium]
MKPKILIASSVESLTIAYAVQENLEQEADITVWTQGVFDLTKSTLDNLIISINNSDYGVFIFSPDDVTKIRDKTYLTIRDNVIFELGLSIGKLGKDRNFIIIPKNVKDLHIPTDILGLIPATFDPNREDGNILAALGPACNKIRRAIQSSMHPLTASESISPSIIDESKKDDKIILEVENRDRYNPYKHLPQIQETTTSFFYERMCDAFPGKRGISAVEDPRTAIDRLEILLRPPLIFRSRSDENAIISPIWWLRGHSANAIEHFKKISPTKCLIDSKELEIDKIYIYRPGTYFYEFVYVLAKAEKPTGVYNLSETDIEKCIDEIGYAYEEYGLLNNNPITRSEYDDGSAEINGVIVDASAAELRVRFLSPYNLIIAAQFSPLNSSEFDDKSKIILNNLLKGRETVDNLAKFVPSLPRHTWDGAM